MFASDVAAGDPACVRGRGVSPALWARALLVFNPT